MDFEKYSKRLVTEFYMENKLHRKQSLSKKARSYSQFMSDLENSIEDSPPEELNENNSDQRLTEMPKVVRVSLPVKAKSYN